MDSSSTTIADKRDLLSRPEALRDLVIEVGCGDRKRYPGSLGIDVSDGPAVDLVGDARVVLNALPPGIARLVTSSHFLEHVPDPAPLLDAMARLLNPGGRIEVIVPHFSNPYYRSDPTHANGLGFGLYTMSYLARDPIFHRQVPSYVRREGLALERVELRFKSAPPFYARHAVKLVLGAIFNSCRYLQEFWEENLCYLFPCYEIRYVLRRSDADDERSRGNS